MTKFVSWRELFQGIDEIGKRKITIIGEDVEPTIYEEYLHELKKATFEELHRNRWIPLPHRSSQPITSDSEGTHDDLRKP